MSSSEQITVWTNSTPERVHFPDGVAWDINDQGVLRVVGLGDKSLAAFPSGRWVLVERTEPSTGRSS